MSNLSTVQGIYESFGKARHGKVVRLRHSTDTAKHIAAYGS